MPDCRECAWLLKDRCAIQADHPLRCCVQAINMRWAELIKPEHSVLEIGCGADSLLRDHCLSNGVHWEGVDIDWSYMGRPTIATVIASVAHLPFASERFDIVVGNQCIEHWEEHDVDLLRGLSEVFRVLRVGGLCLQNFPICFHGGPYFAAAHLDRIRKLFSLFSEEVRLEQWRRNPAPQPSYRHHLRYYWFSRRLRKENSHVVELVARRRRNPPYYHRPPLSLLRKMMMGIRYRGVLYYPNLFLIMLWDRLNKRPDAGRQHPREVVGEAEHIGEKDSRPCGN